jgi:hypothetical protein
MNMTIDKEFLIPKYSVVCSFCMHLIKFRKCNAFNEIPLDIWNGDNNHLKPLSGQDNDIIFEKT